MKFVAALALLLALQTAPGLADDALPRMGPAPDFSLTSQDRKLVSLIALRGKVVVVTFFYTSCPDICPLLIQKLVDVGRSLGAHLGNEITFIAITFDPERDTADILKSYSEAYEATGDGWNFLTGPPAVIRDLSRRYGVVAVKNADLYIDHNLVTTIIDPRGVVRVQYLGTNFDPDAFRHDVLSLVRRP